MAPGHKLLPIYLNDHLAGATLGTNLAKRIADENRDNGFGPVFQELHEQIAEDRGALSDVMAALDIGTDHIKQIGAVVVERVGRFKLNGSLLSYSPLSRLVEIEALALGVTGKLGLWRALDEIQADELGAFDFAALAARA